MLARVGTLTRQIFTRRPLSCIPRSYPYSAKTTTPNNHTTQSGEYYDLIYGEDDTSLCKSEEMVECSVEGA